MHATRVCLVLIIWASLKLTQWKTSAMTTGKGIVAVTEDNNAYCTGTNCDKGNWTRNDTRRADEVHAIDHDGRNWWCPPGYQLAVTTRLCAQNSCLTVSAATAQSVYPGRGQNLTDDSERDDATNPETTQVCLSLTANYRRCRKMALSPNDYIVVEIKRSIRILKTNALILMGEFVIFKNGIAGVCRSDYVPTANPLFTEKTLNAMSPACMPFRVPSKDFRLLPDGSALARNSNVTFKSEQFYDTTTTTASVNVCYEMSPSFLQCKMKLVDEKSFFEFLPDMSIRELVENGPTRPLGEYMMSSDELDVIYCAPHNIQQAAEEKRYLYGAACILSTVFLFLALLAHLLFPSLNYHAKALLCHIISMLVTYLMLAIGFLSELFFKNDQCYIFFAISYIASLSAFLWLSVLAFDLWRIFANLRGTITPGNTKGKRRKFFLQCAYSWGIPAILCILILVFDTHSDWIQLRELCWFTGWSMWIFFYAPIVIILVVNALFFLLTILNLRRASKGTDVLNKKVSRQLFQVFVKLFVVMGLFWFAEIVSSILRGDDRWYYGTDIINALQGVAIFVVYICKKSTWTTIKARLGYGESNSQGTQSSSSQAAKGRKISDTSLTAVSRRGLEMNTVSTANLTENGVYRNTNEN